MVKTFRNRFLLVGLMTTLGFNFASAGDAPVGRQRLDRQPFPVVNNSRTVAFAQRLAAALNRMGDIDDARVPELPHQQNFGPTSAFAQGQGS